MKMFSSFNGNKIENETVKKFTQAGLELVEKHTAKRVNSADFKNKSRALSFKDIKVDDYEKDNHKFNETLMKYCVDNSLGKFAWNGLETLKNPMVHQDLGFQATFKAVISQIIQPVAPAVVSNTYMDIAEIQQVGWGETGRFIVNPNDLFLVNDIAEGVQFGGLQRLYKDEVTVNPTSKQIRYDMPWYQVASGMFDFGEWAYKIGLSFGGYINATVVNSFTSTIASLTAASSPYVASGFTDLHHLAVAQRVKTANANSQVYVYGTMTALGAVIPATAGLQYGLGEEWTKVGYLGAYRGIRLMEIDQALVPGTVNTTANLIIPNDTLYYMPLGGYKPVKIVFEGSNVTIDTIPTETPDKTGGLSITMKFATAVAVGSKFGAITNVVA